MFPCTVSQLLSILAADPASSEGSDEPVVGVSIDSRTVKPGDVFFALPGTKHHGVLFADEAVSRGAVCVVTDHPLTIQRTDRPQLVRFQPADTIEIDRRIVRVPNAIAALQNLAAWNRRQSSAMIIGVTGSVGKTTTRQMIASVLSEHFCGIQSPRNFNNEIGVPLSLLQLDATHDFAVLEFGAGRLGDIAHLAEIAKPEFAVVTRVAAAHLESFGSIESIRRTKQELVESLASSGTAFLNADDPLVCSMKAATSGETVLFGTSQHADVRGSISSADAEACCLDVDAVPFHFHGAQHLATAAMAAIAIGRFVGLSSPQIAAGLAKFRPDAGRGRIVQQTPWTVIDESYNASPASVLATIASLQNWKQSRHRILVLGEMLELGSESAQTHFEIGRALMSSAVDHTLVLGDHAEEVARGARSTGLSSNRISVFHDIGMLQVMLDCLLTPGDVVLVKGSRGMQMERVVAWLQEQSAPLRSAA